MDLARPLFARRMSRGELIGLDVVVAVVLVVHLSVSVGGGAPWWVRVAVPLVLGLPLAVRRIWPRSVALVVVVAAVAANVAGVLAFGFAAPAYALYGVAADGRWGRLPTSTVTGLAVAGYLAVAFVGVTPERKADHGDLVLGVIVMVGAWTVGRAVQERRSYTRRDTELQAGRAVAEERLRIARELHDVVAHSMGLIAVKAGVANHVLRTRPEEATDALRVIESASRDALVEMRHLLGVLRTDPPGLGPEPGLAGLPALVARAELAGVAVDLEVRGVDRLPEGVALSAYRIVQEALTNVVKHAAPARCRVLVGSDGREVRIEVVDDGRGHRGAPGSGNGHGLVGMRERVAVFGGAVEAGPRPDGPGFAVRATLPHGVAARP